VSVRRGAYHTRSTSKTSFSAHFLAKLEDCWLKLRLSKINIPASNKLVLLAGDKTAL
jgi:hypothetical protein